MQVGTATFSRFLAVAFAAAFIVTGRAHAIERNGFDLGGASVPIDAIERGGPPRDGIPAIDSPKFLSAVHATELLPESRVLGVAINGIAKAYPIAILNWHEIVNDRFGDQAVLVSFCPLCGTGIAFDPRIDGRELSFGVSGLLYNSDMLLYDRQTESLWSQIPGVAIAGELAGRALRRIPVEHTTWRDWLSRHPESLALSPQTGHARDYWHDPYDGYERSEHLMFKVRFSDQRFHPKERVLGVSLGGAHKAYPFKLLRGTNSPIHDDVGGQAVRIEHDLGNETARAFDSQGRPLPAVLAYWFAWYAFYPQTAVFAPN